MRRILKIIVIIVLTALLISYAAYIKQNYFYAYDEDLGKYLTLKEFSQRHTTEQVKEIITKITDNWKPENLDAFAHPALQCNGEQKEFYKKMYEHNAVLGGIQFVNNCEVEYASRNPSDTTVNYYCDAIYENGDAQIKIQVVWPNNAQEIGSEKISWLDVDSYAQRKAISDERAPAIIAFNHAALKAKADKLPAPQPLSPQLSIPYWQKHRMPDYLLPCLKFKR